MRARGWSLTDEQLAGGIRSVAAPLRDGDGQVIAAMNVTVHAAETSVETLTGEYLPLLLTAAGAISADWAAYQSVPAFITVRPASSPPGELSAGKLRARLGGTSPRSATLDAPRRDRLSLDSCPGEHPRNSGSVGHLSGRRTES